MSSSSKDLERAINGLERKVIDLRAMCEERRLKIERLKALVAEQRRFLSILSELANAVIEEEEPGLSDAMKKASRARKLHALIKVKTEIIAKGNFDE